MLVIRFVNFFKNIYINNLDASAPKFLLEKIFTESRFDNFRNIYNTFDIEKKNHS